MTAISAHIFLGALLCGRILSSAALGLPDIIQWKAFTANPNTPAIIHMARSEGCAIWVEWLLQSADVTNPALWYATITQYAPICGFPAPLDAQGGLHEQFPIKPGGSAADGFMQVIYADLNNVPNANTIQESSVTPCVFANLLLDNFVGYFTSNEVYNITAAVELAQSSSNVSPVLLKWINNDPCVPINSSLVSFLAGHIEQVPNPYNPSIFMARTTPTFSRYTLTIPTPSWISTRVPGVSSAVASVIKSVITPAVTPVVTPAATP